MKKVRNFLAFGLMAIAATACSSGDVELAKKINTDPSYIGKEVEISGKVETKFSIFVSSNSKFWNVSLKTENALNNQDVESVPLKLAYGKGKSSIYLDIPDSQREYGEKDIKIYDSNGNVLAATDKLKIKGLVEKEGDGIRLVNVTINKD